jgi:hypothetical protein
MSRTRLGWKSAAIFAGVLATAGCDQESLKADAAARRYAEAAHSAPLELAGGTLSEWYRGDHAVLRQRVDGGRGRLWLLTEEGVSLYNLRARGEGRVIPLPGWILAVEPYACPPGLALGPQGEVLVSSNVLPIVWRIDPATLKVTAHELALAGDGGRDVGFTGLAWSAEQGGYFAVSAAHGALWKLDPALETAVNVSQAAALPYACDLHMRLGNQ